jgi:hypothetical protein
LSKIFPLLKSFALRAIVQQYKDSGVKVGKLQAQMKNSSDHDYIVLRWQEGPALSPREERVEMLEMHPREAVISSTLQVDELTQVQLIAGGYRETGVVHSCRAEGGHFVLCIRITSSPEIENEGFERDPGVLSLEGFLTDEQAEQILDELDRELGRDESSATRRALRQMLTSFRLLRLGNVLGRMCEMSRVPTGHTCVVK